MAPTADAFGEIDLQRCDRHAACLDRVEIGALPCIRRGARETGEQLAIAQRDLSDVRGQDMAKRAVEIAAAGGDAPATEAPADGLRSPPLSRDAPSASAANTG